MATRFGLLEIDVELDERASKKKGDKAKPKNDEKNKKAVNKNNAKKKKDNAVDSLQAMAFGGAKGKSKKKAGGGAVPPPVPAKKEPQPKMNGTVDPSDHDQDWHRRDEEFVQTENERSLREALMLSKLDFEEKEKLYTEVKKQEDEGKGGKVKKKKDKPITMSLDQFKNLDLKQLSSKQEPAPPEPPRPEHDEKFFEDIDKAAKKTLERESRQENYKVTAGQFNQALKVSEYEAEIEKRDFEIQALRLEVDSLKSDLLNVKTRNKKLCEVFCSAEMKAKAELVVELDKMSKVREELTQEVADLSALLEQERSKVNQLQLDAKKQGKKK